MSEPTILVVDDEAPIRSLLRSVLKREGYCVLEAADGREAIAICSERGAAINLLLTDIVMPNLDGLQLAEWIFAAYPKMPVLYMSGKCDVDAVQRHVREQGCGFLRKPFAIDVLLRDVRELLKTELRKGVRRQQAPPSASALSG